MTVLLDTSVWVDFFNGHASREAEMLAGFIEDEVDIVTRGVVMAEFFQPVSPALLVADYMQQRMFCQLFGGNLLIIDLYARLQLVQPRYSQRGLAHVDAGDRERHLGDPEGRRRTA